MKLFIILHVRGKLYTFIPHRQWSIDLKAFKLHELFKVVFFSQAMGSIRSLTSTCEKMNLTGLMWNFEEKMQNSKGPQLQTDLFSLCEIA